MARIKNWEKFQHFKDRRPPWVKLYRDLLDDKEWYKLDPKAAKMLVSFWLIASEYDGNLPDIETLSFRLRTTEAEIESVFSMLSHWLKHDDISSISSAISEGYQCDSTETETETETENISPSAKKMVTFSKFIESIPDDQDAIPKDHHVFTYADKVKLPLEFLDLQWIYFERYYGSGAGKAKRYKDWPGHFRTAVESGYGKLWAIAQDGSYYLTTAGKQLQMEVSSDR